MKKFSKIYLPLIAAVVLLLCVLGLSACGDKCEHDWEQGVTVNAGCEHEGAIAYTCKVCGEIKTELTDPIGHSFTKYVDDGNATCEIEGTKTAVCDNADCGKTDTKSVAKRHVYGESWTQAPDGHYHACTVCGVADEIVAHTPDASGNKCSACGFDIHVHTPAKVAAVASTCIAKGNVEYWYCAGCEGYFHDEACTNSTTAEDVLLALGEHRYTEKWFSDGASHWHQCEVCDGEEDGSKVSHVSSGAATETNPEICTVCYYIIAPALGHTTHTPEHVPAVEKTCTENGNVEFWYCEGCGSAFANEECTHIIPADQLVIPAGHDAEHKTALAPSCLADGYLEHWYCADCDKYFSDAFCQFEIQYALIAKPAKHTAINWFASTPVGCEKDGNIAYWYCSDCGKYYTDSAHKNEVTEADTVIAKLGHNAAYVGGKAATCTEKGTKEYWTCINCNKNYTTVDCTTIFDLTDLVIESLGHKQSANADEVIHPTCLAGGYSIFSCERDGCGYKIKNNYTPVGDCEEEQIATTPATCQTAGTITYQCKHCEAETVVYTAKADHNYNTEVVAPTCTEAGYTKYTCKTEGCGYSYRDSEVAATGHSWSDERVEPTCTLPGKITTTCSGCNAESVEAIPALGHDAAPTCENSDECSRGDCDYVAPATGHNYRVAELKAATCTENGYVKYACSNAGCEKPEITDHPESYNATGHAADPLAVWTETEVAVEGEDCTYQVVRTAPCAACGETIETRGEKYTEHKIVVSIKTVATCSVPGVKVHTCSVCSEVLDDNVSYEDSEAHTWGAGVLQADGVTTLYTCACGLTKTSVSAKESTEAKVDSETVKNSDDVELKNATFVPDSDIKDALSGEVEFGAEAKDKSEFELDTEVLDRIGDNPIYDFTMTVDGTPATELGGTMTVRIPYELGDEDPENIMVWYIQNDTVTEVKATYVVIDGKGYAVFETTHFSYYTVTKMKPAERCKLYGHNIKDIVVPATCLTDGYTMHVCTRCGATEADEFVDALGHDFQRNEETFVARTCSVNGYAEYACSRCGVDYEVRENATGHDWVKNNEMSTPATCESTGINVYGCSGCGETKEEYAPALDHNYRTSVKNPTCTEDGYTEKVCRDCGFIDISARKSALGHNVKTNVIDPTCIDDGYTESYCARCDKQFENSAIVKSTGDHVWNLENAGCTEDKVCTACGTRSAKATGHSFGTNGICQNDGCKEKCAHEYSYLKDVEATCTKRAHKLHQCSICFGTKEVEYTGDPIAHQIEKGVCKVCGISSSTHYLAMLQSWKNVDGFSLKIADLAFSVEELIDEESAWYVMVEGALVNVAELMIYVDENGNVAGAATGTLTVTTRNYGKQVEVYSVNAVIENGVVYLELNQGVGEKGASETTYMSVTLDYIIGAIVEESVGLKKEGVAEIVNFIDEKLLPIVNEYVEFNAEEIDDILESLINLVFTEEMTDDGFVYFLDFDKIHEINNDLADLTVSEFIDKYFGESSFADLVATVKEIAGTKIPEIPALLDSYGIDSEKLAAFINEVAAMSGAPEEFDIMEMINSEDMKDVLVADLIPEGGYEELESMIDDIASALENASLYDLIAPEYKEEIRKTVADVISELAEAVHFSFETDAARNISALSFKITELSMNVSDSERLNLNVSVEFTPNGRINVNFDSIIDEINTSVKYPNLDAETESDYNFKELGGEYYVTIGEETYLSEETMMAFFSNYKIDFSNPIATMVMGHCGSRYYTNLVYIATEAKAEVMVYMLENGWLVVEGGEDLEKTVMVMGERELTITYPDGTVKSVPAEEVMKMDMGEIIALGVCDSWYGDETVSYSNTGSLYIFYDKATGEYEIVSWADELHEYELDEANSDINDACGTTSYYHYVCTECGAVRGEYEHNYHETTWKYVLAEGATNCEDGLVELQICTKCDEVLHESLLEKTGHITTSVQIWNEETKSLYNEYECACGMESGRDHSYTLDFDVEVEFGDFRVDDYYMSDVVKFTVPENGIYQFYGKNTGFFVNIYDENGRNVNKVGANGGGNVNVGGDFVDKPGYGEIVMTSNGSAYELEAGKTYYARFSRTSYGSYSDGVVTVDLRESTVYSLAEYGCTCGAEMTVYDEFGKKNVSFSGCSEDCALTYEVLNSYETDENCKENHVRKIVFTTEAGTKELVISTVPTGNFRHDGYGRWSTTRTEAVGENGQLVILETENYYVVCNECGTVSHKTVNTSTYDKKSGEQLGREYKSYSLNYDGELVLETENSYKYVIVNFADGSTERRTAYESEFRYNRVNGEIEDGYSIAYTYNPNNRCLVTVTYTDSTGKVRVYDELQHNEEDKLIVEESGTTQIVDGHGRELTVVTEAYERYCTVCYASISKTVSRRYFTEDNSYVKTETEYYVQFAISEDVYGYVISEKDFSERGSFVGLDGRTYEYTISNGREEYTDGELTYWYKYVYEYNYGNYCQYDSYYYNINNPDGYLEGKNHTSHKAFGTRLELIPGSTTCDDGHEVYNVCYSCGYEQYRGTEKGYGHSTNYGNTTVYDLSEYGSVCGGRVVVYSCPCGERKSVNVEHECDFEQRSEYINLENGYGWRYTYSCAVTEPQCGFSYVQESIYTSGESCKEYYTTRYVFGDGLTVEYRYATGGYRHDYNDVYNDGFEYVEDGYKVIESGYARQCNACGLYVSNTVYKDYFDANGEHIKRLSTNTQYNSDGNVTYRQESEYHYIKTLDGKGSSEFVVRSSNTYYNEMGEETSSEVTIYDRYSSSCPYAPIVTFQSSYGEYWQDAWEHEDWVYSYKGYDPAPTCSQYGCELQVCNWCGDKRITEVPPYDHSFEEHNDEYGNLTYACTRCGLESAVGNNGSVTVEDLTTKFGNGTHYVVGYWNKKDEGYIVTVSLVVKGLDDFVTLDVYAYDDGSKIFVSIEDLIAAIEAQSEADGVEYSLCKDAVRIVFLPIGGSDFDYAITFDPHILTAEIEFSYSQDYGLIRKHTLSCTLCDYAEEQEDCVMNYLYQDGKSIYTCSVCGLQYREYTETVQNGCLIENYLVFDRNIDGEWINVYRGNSGSYYSHEYKCSYVGINDYGYPYHKFECVNCDYWYESNCYPNNTLSTETVTVEGVEYERTYYSCECGYEYYVDRRWELEDASSCYYVQRAIYSYAPEMVSYESTKYSHTLGYVQDGESYVLNKVCSACNNEIDSSLIIIPELPDGLFNYELAAHPENSAKFCLKLTALQSVNLFFTSYESTLDTWGALYDSEWNTIVYSDDYNDRDFGFYHRVEEGETYYFEARPYSDSYYGSFRVSITPSEK